MPSVSLARLILIIICIAKYQFAFTSTEWVLKYPSRVQKCVTVFTMGLARRRAIKVPNRQVLRSFWFFVQSSTLGPCVFTSTINPDVCSYTFIDRQAQTRIQICLYSSCTRANMCRIPKRQFKRFVSKYRRRYHRIAD